MKVRIWGNPRTISNLYCLFSMHSSETWENLSKMAGKSSPDKKHNKSLRLVLFIPFGCCFARSLPFSLSTVKQTKLFHSISEMFFTFLARKTLWVKLFSLNVCKKSGGASWNNRWGFWRETHTPLWLLIGRIIFFHVWKPSFAPLID